ncbi:MAG: DUF3971 domain-containing protein [Pseudomonadota bacterium]
MAVWGMNKRAGKAAIIFLETAAVFLAVFAAGAAYVSWRLQQGPLSLGVFRASVEFAVERRLPENYDCQIGSILLRRRGGTLDLVVSDLKILDADDVVAVEAASVDLTFDTRDFLAGRIGPRTAKATEAMFRVVRNVEQVVEIPAAQGRGGRSVFPSSSGLIQSGFLKSAFARAEMLDAQVTFLDEASGRSWMSKNATVVLDRTDQGLLGTLSGDIDLEGVAASINAAASYAETEDKITIALAGENFPIGDILTTFYGDRAGVVDAPVSGNANLVMSGQGDLKSSAFAARIDPGVLRIAGLEAPINFIEWRSDFDPAENRFSIEHFNYDVADNRGSLSGSVGLVFADDLRDPRRVNFDLQAKDFIVAVPGRLSSPLSIEAGSFSGAYDISERRLDFEALAVELVETVFRGDFSYQWSKASDQNESRSPGVKASIIVDGKLDPQRLLKIWPLGVAMGARDWVEDRMERATIENIVADINLPPGAVRADGLIPDDAINVEFDVKNAKAYYVKQMTPLTQTNGHGVLRGNSFLLRAKSGRIGDIRISDGEVEFPVFIPKWQETFFRFKATGRAEKMLGLLDQEPLILLSKINLSPDQFAGDAVADVEIMRPNRRDVAPDEYKYNGTATFSDTTVSALAGDATITQGNGAIDLNPRSLTVTGDAKLADAPVNIIWTQRFFDEDGPSELAVKGLVDASVGDLFGLSVRQYVRGPVDLDLKALGDIGDFKSAQMTADLSQSSLSIDVLDWSKPAGAPASSSLSMEFSGADVTVDTLQIKGEGIELNGSLSLKDGVLADASFPKVLFDGAADLALSASRKPDGALDLVATGDYLSIAPALRTIANFGSNDSDDGANESFWGAGLAITARLNGLGMRDGVEYRDVSLDLWRNAERLQALELSALHSSMTPLRVTLSHMGADEGPERLIEASAGSLGDFLKGAFGFSSLQGGQGSMAIRFGGDNMQGLSGELEARDLHIINAPLLARIFSAGSLDGLANLVGGEGIDLSYAYGEFAVDNNSLSLDGFRATGPSVGMTAEGDIAFANDGPVSLSGAVAPVYQLNSALGAAPIIGDILVGKQGEGVLALSYSVNGPRNAPNVFVNPLSALTPGIFRQLFQVGSASQPEAEDIDPADGSNEPVIEPE